MSVAPSSSLIGPRSLDLRAEYLRRQAEQRRRAVDTRALSTLTPKPVTALVQPTYSFIGLVALAQLVVPVAEPMVAAPRRVRKSRPLGLHIASIGILAGLVAVVAIAFSPAKSVARPTAPVAHGDVAPQLATPAQTPLAKAITAPAKPTDRLIISSINVNASVTEVGLTKDGSLDAPRTLWQVAHYKDSPEPGNMGTSIIDGHSGAPGSYGVLENLSRVRVGDLITYKYVGGLDKTFRVMTSSAFADDQASANYLFKNDGNAMLNLVSCYGTWDPNTKTYNQRWIITSELVK